MMIPKTVEKRFCGLLKQTWTFWKVTSCLKTNTGFHKENIMQQSNMGEVVWSGAALLLQDLDHNWGYHEFCYQKILQENIQLLVHVLKLGLVLVYGYKFNSYVFLYFTYSHTIDESLSMWLNLTYLHDVFRCECRLTWIVLINKQTWIMQQTTIGNTRSSHPLNGKKAEWRFWSGLVKVPT